jgi:hypothetical protein
MHLTAYIRMIRLGTTYIIRSQPTVLNLQYTRGIWKVELYQIEMVFFVL